MHDWFLVFNENMKFIMHANTDIIIENVKKICDIVQPLKINFQEKAENATEGLLCHLCYLQNRWLRDSKRSWQVKSRPITNFLDNFNTSSLTSKFTTDWEGH